MIHAYYMNLNGDCSYEQSLALYNLLPEERRKRIRNMQNKDAARRGLYAGAFLQIVLGRELGIPANIVSYNYGKQGKPQLDVKRMEERLCGKKPEGWYSPLHFNLTHSGEYAALAVSDQVVGIDIEYKKKNALKIAKRFFCPEEYEIILAAGDVKAQEQLFLEYWTMKEAYVKYSGKGLELPLSSFLIRKEKVNGLSRVQGTEIWFSTFFLEGENYCVSICSGDKNELEKIATSICKIKQKQLFTGTL
ncbi:MAG: 4'-phosphopantetheinyl transferase superfamily protein [Lachnospiraceae bacterium]|nr:4'-phosphopantetheinyl transferase superfamily protein [Lachnospiraceae bacterium]